MSVQQDLSSPVAGSRRTVEGPTWVGVRSCADPYCGDILCLYRHNGELLAWCRERLELIGACPGCGTAVRAIAASEHDESLRLELRAAMAESFPVPMRKAVST